MSRRDNHLLILDMLESAYRILTYTKDLRLAPTMYKPNAIALDLGNKK